MEEAVRREISPTVVPEIGASTKCRECTSRNIELRHLPYHLDRNRKNTNLPEVWQEGLSAVSSWFEKYDLRIEPSDC